MIDRTMSDNLKTMSSWQWVYSRFGGRPGDDRKKFFVPLFLALWIPGCALPKRTVSVGKDWRTANIHKIVVICIQGDQTTNRRIESDMVPKLRHQGFDAVAARDLFSAASKYSPKRLMVLMRRAQIDGIMEVTYSGEIPADGLPQQFQFKYHSLKGQTTQLSGHPLPLDAAFIALIGT